MVLWARRWKEVDEVSGRSCVRHYPLYELPRVKTKAIRRWYVVLRNVINWNDAHESSLCTRTNAVKEIEIVYCIHELREITKGENRLGEVRNAKPPRSNNIIMLSRTNASRVDIRAALFPSRRKLFLSEKLCTRSSTDGSEFGTRFR